MENGRIEFNNLLGSENPNIEASIVEGVLQISKTLQPIRYGYEPQENITIYELALIIPILLNLSSQFSLSTNKNWGKVKRHFREV